MKKTIYSSLALGAVLGLASCASDEPLGNNQNDGSLSFTISLPGQNTRFAEGTSVDKLYYSVFDTEGNLVLQDNQDWPAGSLTTTVTLQLVANQSYDIVFFADNSEAEGKGYSYNAETAQFSMTYGQDMVNNDIFDAFVKNEKGVVADGNAKTVTLTRPFAQLNIGTNDLTNAAVAKYGLSNFSSTLSIAKENVLSGINFLNGNTTAQGADLSFAIADFSTLPEDAFPVSGYSYIEMNYLLVAPTEDAANLINATYTINGKAGAATVNTLNLASTPVRQNYRTNIYGSLLTTQNAFTVTIDPAFGEPSYNIASVWDGTTVIAPDTDAEGNMSVNNAAQLAGLYEVVNAGNDLDGKTVTLNTDVDLAGSSKWKSIGTSSKPFKGTLDGNGKEIKGMRGGLFGYATDATIKDLNVSNISTGTPSAILVNTTNGDVNISGVTVNGNATTAGFIYWTNPGTVTIDGSVNRAQVKNTSYCAGGFVGRTKDTKVIIKNSDNYGDISCTRYSQGKAGGFVGMPAHPGTVTLENCTNYGAISVNTSQGGAVGGMIGWFGGLADMTGCVNNGSIDITVSNVSSIVLAGGLIGGSGWFNDAVNAVDCTNNGNVTAHVTSMKSGLTAEYQYGIYAGGLIGYVCYNGTTVTGSTNNGNVTATTDGTTPQKQYIGGIAGGLGWMTGITITNNTIPSSVTLSGNQGENSFISALFSDPAPGNNKNITDTPNNANPTISAN